MVIFFYDAEAIEGQDGKSFMPMGCFKESKNSAGRALPDLIVNMRGKIDWRNLKGVVDKCAHKVGQKNSTLKVITNI